MVVKHKKLNFGYNMTIIKSIMCANFEEPRSRDGDLRTLNLRKNCHFCLENLLLSLKFELNSVADRDRIRTKFGGARSRDRDFRN